MDGLVKSRALLMHRPSCSVHCSSFTQTLILLHTSVRLHQYGEVEAALDFFFLNPQQHNRSDDSVSALLLIKLNLKQYLNSVDHQRWVTVFCPIELEKSK